MNSKPALPGLASHLYGYQYNFVKASVCALHSKNKAFLKSYFFVFVSNWLKPDDTVLHYYSCCGCYDDSQIRHREGRLRMANATNSPPPKKERKKERIKHVRHQRTCFIFLCPAFTVSFFSKVMYSAGFILGIFCQHFRQ